MNSNIINIISKFLLPFIFIFAIYLLSHGEDSPGGAFQAGAVIASYFILEALLMRHGKIVEFLSNKLLLILSFLGVFIYFQVGLISVLIGSEFLNYNVLFQHSDSAQRISIMIVEIGITLTVSSTIILIYKQFEIENDSGHYK